ncbi:hypothetical protein C488_16929 [Natrinema pellirubrum DSM 15624]|uniref:Uncharacterized protein n=1 Tax=Natrinema pellirubrum (strain DSM 15624 / CIP 106293 / JCM 10476 / NCIMB 786 / 157) TaxID=797303 RepID=L9YC55_NATP1|nr:hypothetical protein [Natrinema pellirubrum]ELY71635.1 hypothetical protein C488_16929 [Natrinema pellirubrum DSM 15624]
MRARSRTKPAADRTYKRAFETPTRDTGGTINTELPAIATVLVSAVQLQFAENGPVSTTLLEEDHPIPH